VTELTSAALTALESKLPLHESRFKSACQEIRRITKLKHADFLDHTSVSSMMDVSKSTIAAPPENLAGRTTGDTAQAEAKRQQDDLDRTLKGEPLVERTDTNARLDELNRQAQAEERAVDFLKKQIAAERGKLSVEHCKALKPKEAEMMKRLYKSLADVHAVHSEINDARQNLIDSGIGLRGVFLDMPDFLDNPRSKHSELAEYFRRGKEAGFVNAVPKGFQL
jgi:hypothetical protein